MTSASIVPIVADKVPRMKVLRSAGFADDSSKNTKWIFLKVKLSNQIGCDATFEKVALMSAP